MLNPETFNDVENNILRAYNRTMTALSIHDEDGAEATAAYLDQFNEQDRAALLAMLLAYRQDPEKVKSKVRDIAHASLQ